MIDIHSHILPFVDDGSKSMESSIAMLREEIENGITDVILTPHHYIDRYTCPSSEIKQRFEELQREIKAQGLNINIYLGMEIYYTSREDIISMLDSGELLTMNNTKYVLIEFHLEHEPENFEDIVYNFSCHGYKLIIAHVERYHWMTPDMIRFLNSEGALLQINASSLFGKEGFLKSLYTARLLRSGLISFVASDIHFFRNSYMKKAKVKFKSPQLFENDILIR